MKKISILATVVLSLVALPSCAVGPHFPPTPKSIYEVPLEELGIPPIGRWKALYTQDFATKYNLPQENISNKLSPGVDYIEMQVLPYGPTNATGCFLNLLVKQPNNISLIDDFDPRSFEDFNNSRQLTKFVTQPKPSDLRRINSLSFGTNTFRRGLMSYGFDDSALAFYSPSYVRGYDYITLNAYCKTMSRNRYLAKDFALRFRKSEIWGKYDLTLKDPSDPRIPKGNAYYKTFSSIPIPYEITQHIFEGIF